MTRILRRCFLIAVYWATLPAGWIAARAQLPSAPAVPWQPPATLRLKAPGEAPAISVSPASPLSLAALIDLAEARNPQTRAAWEQAKQAAAAKGVAKSELFPLLTGLVLSQTLRNGVLFNSAFVRQTEGIFEPALELDYTVFDWNGRLDAEHAARYRLFGADFAFNNVHLQIIESVASSYYGLLNSQGQVAAAQINLQNATTVASNVDARLALGLATLPDDLEARAAAAQAAYDLVSLQGAQRNAQANLATTLRLPAGTVLPVVPLDRLAPPPVLEETAVAAIAHALEDRPDLLQQETQVAAAAQAIRQARTAYFPQIRFTAVWGRVRAYGEQDLLPETYGSSGVWNAQLNLNWTLFDGGRRRSDLENAKAGKALAEALLDADRDRIEDQVWTAYTNAQTAFAQQGAAELLLQASGVSYAAATEAYGNGVRTLVDVVTAQRTLAQARQEEVSARTNLFQQVTTLAFRTGELLRSHAGPTVLPSPVAAPSGVPPIPPGLLAPSSPNGPPGGLSSPGLPPTAPLDTVPPGPVLPGTVSPGTVPLEPAPPREE